MLDNSKSKRTITVVSILICSALLLGLSTFVATGAACVTLPGLDVEANVGSLHFRGEIAEFYVLVSLNGAPVDAALTAKLYFNGSQYADLTSAVGHVATGLYRIPYTIPGTASAGTYAMVVSANHTEGPRQLSRNSSGKLPAESNTCRLERYVNLHQRNRGNHPNKHWHHQRVPARNQRNVSPD